MHEKKIGNGTPKNRRRRAEKSAAAHGKKIDNGTLKNRRRHAEKSAAARQGPAQTAAGGETKIPQKRAGMAKQADARDLTFALHNN